MLDVILKAVYLGLSGAGLSLPMVIYLLYSSVKTGSHMGGRMFAGRLSVTIIACGVTALGGGWLFNLGAVGAVVNFAGAAASCALGASLLVSVYRDHAAMDIEALWEPAPPPEGYEDIYAQENDRFRREAEYEYRMGSGAGRAFLWGMIFTATNLSWLQWCGIPAKTLTIRAFDDGGGGILGVLYAAVFLIVLALAELFLFQVLSKLASLLQKVVTHFIFRILAGVTGACLVLSAVMMLWQMVKNLRLLGS